MKSRIAIPIALILGGFAAGGCVRPPEESFVSSEKVSKLSEKSQGEIRTILAERCGSPSAIKLLGAPKTDRAHLQLGEAVYTQYCRQCHGVSGDGNGPAAAYLLPRPRDYRKGTFKFTSTAYGAMPLREDLIRTVKRGIAGTSMPAFHLLPQKELEAVIDYVLALTHRGELESMLADAAEQEEALEASTVDDMIDSIATRWSGAREQVNHPLSPMPVFTADHVAEGKAAFLSKGCIQCHGEDGRGQLTSNIGVDIWGRPTQAADLTSGMLRGGTEPLDVYRHIAGGINGTPMPSFGGLFQDDPDAMWKITAFVLDLSNRRRKGDIPEAGLLKPLPGVEPAAKAPADAAPAAATTAAPATSVTGPQSE